MKTLIAHIIAAGAAGAVFAMAGLMAALVAEPSDGLTTLLVLRYETPWPMIFAPLVLLSGGVLAVYTRSMVLSLFGR